MNTRPFILLLFAIVAINNPAVSQNVFSSWEQFHHTWDSLEAADNTYFDYLDVEDWKVEFDQLSNQYPEVESEDEQFLRDYLEAYFIFFLSDYTRSIPLYKKLLSDRSKMTDNQLNWCLVNMEESYRRTGNLKEAIPFTKERVELGFDDDFFHIYEEAGLYREAIIEYMEHNDLPKAPIRAQGYYSRLGRLLRQNGQLDSAIYYYKLAYDEGLKIIDKEDYPGKSVYHHRLRKYYTHQMRGEIGLIYVEQGKYTEAIPYLEKDIATCKEVNEIALQVPKRLGLAEAFLALGDRKMTKLHLDTARQINDQTDWVMHEIKYMQIAGKYYFERGQFDSAAILFQASNLLSDSIETLQRKNKLIATTAFLDNERQGKLIASQRLELEKAEVSRAKQRNQLGLLIAAILIAVLLIIVFYFDARRKRKAEEKAIRDKEVITKQAEKLKELDEVKTRFFSNISHEFRTPLTLIEGPIQSIISGRVTSEHEQKENLLVAERNTRALKALIDEVLDFNKIEASDIHINLQPTHVREWLDELIENYRYIASSNDLSFEYEVELPEGLALMLDTQKVEHLLNNLVSNAAKHASRQIKCQLFFEAQKLSVIVSDDGKGITEEELPFIFDRFYQTSHGRQIAHSSGIGLAYVKELVTLFGGGVNVTSKPGEGTTFQLSIPVEKVDMLHVPLNQDEVPEYSPGPYSFDNNKLLIVEDNSEMRQYIRQVVGEEFEVELCANGVEALEKLADYRPDLIICDVMMPLMDGMELLKEIKKSDKDRLISFVMLTARRSQELKLEALSLGLDDYMNKPFNPLELEIRVKNLLKNQHTRQQWLKDTPKGSEKEEQVPNPFVEDIKSIVLDNLGNKQFGVLTLAGKFNMSDRQLTRVTRQLTGMSPAAFIREVRLNKAMEIMLSKQYKTVSEVAGIVGLGRASHFSKVFFERFGKNPSRYL